MPAEETSASSLSRPGCIGNESRRVLVFEAKGEDRELGALATDAFAIRLGERAKNKMGRRAAGYVG
jgi:hypothetical protein